MNPDDPGTGRGGMLGGLNPRQRRILLALLAGGALALVALLSRRTSAAGGGAPATPTYGAAGTFADNGAVAAGLSTDVTGALGQVAVALDQLPELVGVVVRDTLPLEPVPTAPSPAELAGAFAGAFAPIAAAFTNAGAPNGPAVKSAASAVKSTTLAVPVPTAAQAQAIAKPNIGFNANPESARAGLAFKTVVKDSKVYRFFETKPGRGDYGKREQDRIFIRPATT